MHVADITVLTKGSYPFTAHSSECVVGANTCATLYTGSEFTAPQLGSTLDSRVPWDTMSHF